MSRPPLRKNYQFTWNNYDDAAIASVEQFASEHCSYLIYGKEVAPSTGTPHLQAFFSLKKQLRITQLVKLLQGCHFTAHDDKVEAGIEYCKKEGDWKEFGIPPKKGKRNELADFRASVDAGMEWDELMVEHDRVMAKHRGYCAEYFAMKGKKVQEKPVEEFQNRSWYQKVYDAIANPCDRKIYFFADKNGGSGKSTLVKQLLAQRSDIQVFKPEKEANIALCLDTAKTIFLFDCPKSRMSIPLPYNVLEGLKDGMVMSGKYESRMKYPSLPNTVIVFSNEVPHPEALSRDRYVVWYYCPKIQDYCPCELNATNTWDVLHPRSRGRLMVVTNHFFEEEKRKRENASMADMLLRKRYKRAQNGEADEY